MTISSTFYFKGKTSLAKLLSKDSSMKPENKLFATLDTTAHQGKLPSGMSALFVDTVGFISDLPHELVESFATTLEDVKTSVSIADFFSLVKITINQSFINSYTVDPE